MKFRVWEDNIHMGDVRVLSDYVEELEINQHLEAMDYHLAPLYKTSQMSPKQFKKEMSCGYLMEKKIQYAIKTIHSCRKLVDKYSDDEDPT